MPPQAGPERREDSSRQGGRPDRGERGDRGGRGRRGRRRRGGSRGGQSGLPESKYFSPRGEAAAEAPGEAGDGEPQETRSSLPPPGAPEIDEEFMVLPGESLAKYAVADYREEEEEEGAAPEAIEEAEPAEIVEREPVAAAKPEKPAASVAHIEPSI